MNDPSDKIYFIRRNGRITGPFSQKRLLTMVNAGDLKYEDLYSTDKEQWQLVSLLFAPPPRPQEEQEKEEVPSLQAALLPKDDDSYQLKSVKLQKKPPLPQKPSEPLPEVPPPESDSFWSDLGRCIALYWNFSGVFPACRNRPGRMCAIAAGLTGIVFILMALWFAPYISTNGSRLFVVVMTLGMFSWVSLLALAAAKLCGKIGDAGEWLITAAALIMDYGAVGGAVLAWYGGLRQGRMELALLLGFLTGVSFCASILQTKAFGKLVRGVSPHWIYLAPPVFGCGALTVIFLFMKWM